MLGMDADTVALTSVAKRMKQAGRGVGIMSSVCLNDATPAAFYASRPNRGDYYEIALQGACSGFDFLAGAYFRDPYGTKAGTPAMYLQSIKMPDIPLYGANKVMKMQQPHMPTASCGSMLIQ